MKQLSFDIRARIALLTLLAVRMAGMALIPLNETTEARYGEIARKMLETGNWVTLWHDYGVPFWAKPPLYAWLSAASMGLLGVSEFAARLPSLLVSIATLALVGHMVSKRHGREPASHGREPALAAMVILAGSIGFFVNAGAVMTDPSLVFCVTLVLVSFWNAMKGGRAWSWMFFVGCGLGLLTKGPVALVLAGLPVFFWVLLRRQWKPLWEKLPWIRGSLLTLAIAAPWYALAEIRTPGFLQYFIVGENISRFLDPHWKGDLYGFAHAFPYGMIWLFVLTAALPWSLVALRWCKERHADKDGWLLYLVLWSVTSPLFFTFAANIIWPYAFIMLPGFALLLTEVCVQGRKAYKIFVPVLALVTALAGAAGITAFMLAPEKVSASQKDIIAAWRATSPPDDGALIFWSNRNEFAAAFYSGGRAKATEDPAVLNRLLHNEIRDCIVTYDYNAKKLPRKVRADFQEVTRLANKRGVRILLCEQ